MPVFTLLRRVARPADSQFGQQRRRQILPLIVFLVSTGALTPQAAHADVASLPPVNLNAQIAQLTAPPQYIPTDVTPFTVMPERNSFSPGLKFKIFQALPERLWFNVTTEVSQRLDTNVLFTSRNYKADYAFRVLPNITVGYNIFKNTSFFGNYFAIKDVFARNYNNINFPTTQSLSWGIQHNQSLGRKNNLQYVFQARELWQTAGLHQFDFLPGLTLSRSINQNNYLWTSTILQLRGGDYFVAPTREIDPFYTVGYMHRHNKWTFVMNDTLVTNFRHPPFNDSIPRQSNMSMIADFEVNHPISKKMPALLAFVRAEPIWNWDSHRAPGISGFNFRLYGGLRLSMAKPSYYGAMDNMRKQLMQPKAPAKAAVPESLPVSSTSSDAPLNSTDPHLHPAIPTSGAGQASSPSTTAP